MKSFSGLFLSILVTASPVTVHAIHSNPASILSASKTEEIPGGYIIKFKSHVTHDLAAKHYVWAQDLHIKTQRTEVKLRKRSQTPMLDNMLSGLKHTYNIGDSMIGYSGYFDENVVKQIRMHPDVELVERDQEVHALEHDVQLEKNAPWGLARISHRDRLRLSTFNKYLYTESAGEGVDVYVIDTGIHVDHVDFEGRAVWGKTIPQGDEDKDGNGHGTHCSGTIAGKKYGVAKKAHVKAVKVLRTNGSGSMSDVIKGVEFAAESHLKQVDDAKKGKRKGFKGSAANMSLGGSKSSILNQAVNAAVDVGIHFAVAAGNDNTDSCNYSPAAAENAITVGASTLTDERAYFSNYGKCNDIFAPGLEILSTWIGSRDAVFTSSGTSMASPHIAGLLAYLLSLQPNKESAYTTADITPKKLKASLIAIGTLGALTDIPSNTANILAWNGGGLSNYSSIIEDSDHTIHEGKVSAMLEKIET